MTNCSSVRSPWTNCSKNSRASAVGARPSKRRSATALSTALRLRRQSETVIALGAAAVDMSILSLSYLGAPNEPRIISKSMRVTEEWMFIKVSMDLTHHSV